MGVLSEIAVSGRSGFGGSHDRFLRYATTVFGVAQTAGELPHNGGDRADQHYIGRRLQSHSDGGISVPLLDLGSSALNLANVVTSIAANITYLLQAWHVI
ncbi:hypothetical protein [Nocardia sp. NPDC049149]|uniref:hypothetical protein n=1 Tax=Nocardia sp. NPDC049149 TaxID=3364315 RepID=UPI00371C9BC6